MLSWLIGSPSPPWTDLDDIFEDYRNVAIYVDDQEIVQLVKVSDIDDFYSQFSVLIHPKYFKKYKVYYLKMEKYVAFPTTSENIIKFLVNLKGWRGIRYYYNDEFLGGWVLYDCERCREKQRTHLSFKEEERSFSEVINFHLKIYNS